MILVSLLLLIMFADQWFHKSCWGAGLVRNHKKMTFCSRFWAFATVAPPPKSLTLLTHLNDVDAVAALSSLLTSISPSSPPSSLTGPLPFYTHRLLSPGHSVPAPHTRSLVKPCMTKSKFLRLKLPSPTLKLLSKAVDIKQLIRRPRAVVAYSRWVLAIAIATGTGWLDGVPAGGTGRQREGD